MTRVVEIENEITKFCRGPDFRRVMTREDYWAVVLVGPRDPHPARFGDNKGVIAATLGRTQNVKTFIADANKNERFQPLEALHVAWTISAAHANRLHEAMTLICLGPEKENAHYRKWFDWTDNAGRWDELVSLAQATLKARGETVEAFSDAEMRRRIFQASKTPWRRAW